MYKHEITEKEKLAFEAGYRAACVKHCIPFTNVDVIQCKTLRICVEHSLYSIRYPLTDIVKFVSDDVARKLEKAIKEHGYGKTEDICIQH